MAWMDFADEPDGCADAVLNTLEIHPLVREDMVVHANRPKVDNYRDYLYLVIHSARWDADRPFLDSAFQRFRDSQFKLKELMIALTWPI